MCDRTVTLAKIRSDLLKRYAPSLIRTKWGFYHYEPEPTKEELRAFYAEQYYQEGGGGYELTYTADEIEHWRLKAWLIYQRATILFGGRKGRMLDIGCGEGWILDAFAGRGWSVEGIDFSSFGIAKFHPHLLPTFKQGDFDDFLTSCIRDGQRWDVIMLGNVIEHVIEPVGLLRNLREVMDEHSILVIVAPNDFSLLHKHLLAHGYITEHFWLGYPTHLSYFNKKSMECLLTDLGFSVPAVVAGNPIDLNLLNDNSNYIADRFKGKATHRFRVRTDNFLASIDRDKFLALSEILGSMGVGRDLTYYCQRRAA